MRCDIRIPEIERSLSIYCDSLTNESMISTVATCTFMATRFCQDPELEVKINTLQSKYCENWRRQLESLLILMNLVTKCYRQPSFLNDSQTYLLRNYCQANKLLIFCIDNSFVSRNVVQEIMYTLLLPIVEVERLKMEI